MKKLVVALLFAVGCAPSPKEVVTKLDAALATKNVEQATLLLADDVKITTEGKTVVGKDEAKKVIEGWLAANAKVTLVGEHVVEGNKIAWTEKLSIDDFTKLGLESLEAKNEAVIEAGLIKSLTMDLTPEANEKLQAAIAETHKKVAVELDKLLNAKNVDGVVALFHNDAVVSSLQSTWTGTAQLKEGLTALVAKNLVVTPAEYQVAGNKVTWLSKVASDDLTALKLEGLETKNELVIENGKVKSLTTVYTAEASQKLQEATATASAAPVAKKGKK